MHAGCKSRDGMIPSRLQGFYLVELQRFYFLELLIELHGLYLIDDDI